MKNKLGYSYPTKIKVKVVIFEKIESEELIFIVTSDYNQQYKSCVSEILKELPCR
jgi:hypothetical protein